jgi:hypothetical protein
MAKLKGTALVLNLKILRYGYLNWQLLIVCPLMMLGFCYFISHFFKQNSPGAKAGPSVSTLHRPTLPSPLEIAVLEMDPLSLPWGHEIIDGGLARLERTTTRLRIHQLSTYCIAMLEPPSQAVAHLRDQVHNSLVGPLQRYVIYFHPSLFGVGLYQLSGPNSDNMLVQHGNYKI